jgi:16S rRNA (cytosine1402-N4)-methyltransferase
VRDGEGRLALVAATFSAMEAELAALDVLPVDGVTMDIGVSSMQLDQAERGFSFQADGPLDMRMSQAGETAADFLNTADEEAIADVIYRYGEEPKSRRIARAIVAARPITRTAELAAVVRRALGHKPHDKKDPATRTFQAIRIHLNRELDELAEGLAAAERVLKPGGRLAVVTFHSLEDRLVKRFLRDRSGAAPSGSRHLPVVADAVAPSFDHVGRGVRAGAAEIARNPRARSATLRTARRTAAAAWKEGQAR